MSLVSDSAITVFLADDNLLVRSGVATLLSHEPDLAVVGEAADYQGLVAGAEATHPDVVVTDIRMPPTFQQEGIDAARLVRSRHPGTGVVVLSQFDDPEYAVALLAEGSAGYGYLLKDRVAEPGQLAGAIRTVAAGGTALDPIIIDRLMRPVTADGDLTQAEETLLAEVASGRTIKAIAAARDSTPETAAADVEKLFLRIAEGASQGTAGALRRLRMLHQAIVDREEQGETLSRLLPGGVAEKLRIDGCRIGETERVEVTVVMSDIRGFCAIAEKSDPGGLAAQLNEHRVAMNEAVLRQDGTLMLFVGDAVVAVFGAPFPQADHAERGYAAAAAMHAAQASVNEAWAARGLPAFGLGIGVSSGIAAAVLLGSDERLEYTVIGDTVNLAQRLSDLARPAGRTLLSQGTWQRLRVRPVQAVQLDPTVVKGREAPVVAWSIEHAQVDSSGSSEHPLALTPIRQQ
jgi:adenylate cyclase